MAVHASDIAYGLRARQRGDAVHQQATMLIMLEYGNVHMWYMQQVNVRRMQYGKGCQWYETICLCNV